MAVKCNITQDVLAKLFQLNYGLKYCKDTDISIIQNYIEYLNCPEVNLQPCGPNEPCENDPVIFNCNINVLKSTLDVTESLYDFHFIAGDIRGGIAPFTYSWSFDTAVFTASSPTNQPQLLLSLNAGKSKPDIVSQIVMTVTDGNGCVDTRTCTIIGETLNCNNNYEPCVNSINLQILNKITNCGGPSSLLVTKKV